MTLLRPLYMQPGIGDSSIQYTAQDDRASLLSAVFSREGVLDADAGQLKVVQRAAGANFSVDIAAGRAAIIGDDVSDQGTYVVTNTATVNLATPVAPGSGTRVHRVVAQVKDKLHNGLFTTYEWTLELLQDTGSGTPATPFSAISLATISIAAGAASVTNANIVDTRPRASVGTPDRSGTFPLHSNYSVPDGTRPLTWRRNPDGWVSLSGWARWAGTTQTVSGLTLWEFTTAGNPGVHGVPVPVEMRPPSTRDFPGICSAGPLQYTLDASGWLYYRFINAQDLINGSTWWSFDGCGYRI